MDQLADYLCAWVRQPFDWRHHNCAHLVLGWASAVSGQTIGHAQLGRYSTPRGALRALRRAGHSSLVSLTDEVLAAVAQRHPPHGRGDVLVVDVPPHGPLCALSLGDGAVAFAATRGLLIAHTLPVLAAWELRHG